MSEAAKTKKFEQTDRLLIALAIAALLLFSSFALNDDLFNWLFKRGRHHSDKPVIGEILSIVNDARHRDSLELSWDPGVKHADIRAGDGIFTGSKSKAKVLLKDGARIDMDENTLIIFADVNGKSLPGIDRGNFVLNLQGHLTMSLKGVVTEFSGQDSRVQVFVDQNNKPRIRLLSGKASVKNKERQFELKPEKTASTTMPDIQEPPPPILAAAARVFPLQELNEYPYVDKLGDLYEPVGPTEFRERDTRLPQVKLPVLIRWKIEGLPKIIYGQLANTRGFTAPYNFRSIGNSYDLSTVNLGDNYWRVSTDGQKWEEAYFKITPHAAATAAPNLRIVIHRYEMADDSLRVEIPIESTSAYKAYLVEVAPQPIFVHGQTQLRWVTDGKLEAEFTHPGEYYFRVRGVNSNYELSKFSEADRINVVHAPHPGQPLLQTQFLHGYTGETVQSQWTPSKHAASYLLEVFDEQGKQVHSNSFRTPALRFRSKKAGLYKFRVTALDKFGQRSAPSEKGTLDIEDRIVLEASPPLLPDVPPPARQPAQASSVLKPEPENLEFDNSLYTSSDVAAEGALSTAYSRNQIAAGDVQAPYNILATLRTHIWRLANGFEGAVTAKVANLNTTGGLYSPMDIEGPLHAPLDAAVSPVLLGQGYANRGARGPRAILQFGRRLFCAELYPREGRLLVGLPAV